MMDCPDRLRSDEVVVFVPQSMNMNHIDANFYEIVNLPAQMLSNCHTTDDVVFGYFHVAAQQRYLPGNG